MRRIDIYNVVEKELSGQDYKFSYLIIFKQFYFLRCQKIVEIFHSFSFSSFIVGAIFLLFCLANGVIESSFGQLSLSSN